MKQDYELPDTLAYIDGPAITADALRAAAGAHPLCVGYPEGVPETWRMLGAGRARCWTLDPAALLGPMFEPVDWPERDGRGDDEC